MLWLWVLGYLAMDTAYVTASLPAYMERVSAISGTVPKDVTKVALCALGAYALMAVGWAMIVVPGLKRKDVLGAAAKGALYGAVLYGVFNFTTGAMFDEWSWGMMARDAAWGTASLAAWTAAYVRYGT